VKKQRLAVLVAAIDIRAAGKRRGHGFAVAMLHAGNQAVLRPFRHLAIPLLVRLAKAPLARNARAAKAGRTVANRQAAP
jgi:hypothetical protein